MARPWIEAVSIDTGKFFIAHFNNFSFSERIFSHCFSNWPINKTYIVNYLQHFVHLNSPSPKLNYVFIFSKLFYRLLLLSWYTQKLLFAFLINTLRIKHCFMEEWGISKWFALMRCLTALHELKGLTLIKFKIRVRYISYIR